MQSSFWKSRTFRFWVICYVIILLVPITAGMALYRYTADTLTQKAYDNGRMSVQQVCNVVDEQLKTVSNISDTICVSSTLVRLKYMSLPFNAHKYYDIHTRAKYLANFTTQQALIKYIYVYCSDLQCLLDSGHIYTRDNQLSKVVNQRIGLSDQDFQALMEQNHQRDFYVLNQGKSIIVVQTLGTRASEKRPIITLVIVLNADAVRNLLVKTSDTVNGSAYMLLPSGSVFGDYAVDDPVNYSDLSTLYGEGQGTKDGLVVTYADSDVTPFRFVLSIPSTTFLKDITSMQLAFLYFAVGTLVLGLMAAYLLAKHNYKPLQQLKQAAHIPEKSIDDFTALSSKLNELLNAGDQMHTEIEQLSRAANTQLYTSVLAGNINALEKNRRRQLDGIFTGNVFVAALVDLGEEEASATPESSKAVLGSLNLLASEYAGPSCQCVIQPNNNAYAAIFCFAGNVSHNDAQFAVQQICDQMIRHAMEQPALAAMSIYVGDAKDGIENVHLSYNNALKAREYAEFVTETEKRVILYDETMFSSDIAWQDYDIVDAERQFTRLMMEGNYSKGEQLLKEIMAYYNCRDGMSLYVMRCRMFGVMNMMLNVLHEVEPDLGTSFYEETNPVARLLSARTRQELEDVIFEVIDRLVGRQESKTPDIQGKLTQIEHYIAAHYYDVGLGVKQVADAFNMSLPYLSRVFKKEKGIGLLYYINNYRVQKAKEIMEIDKNASVAEIAGRVGYNSSQTLIRIFKRYEGTTPGQFQTEIADDGENDETDEDDDPHL
jgi:two-component system, response regulator YesN